MNFRYCDNVALVFLPKNPFLLKNSVKMPLQASIFTCIIKIKYADVNMCVKIKK